MTPLLRRCAPVLATSLPVLSLSLSVLSLLAASPARAAWDEPPHRATLFLNFDGAHLEPGNNAALDQSKCLLSPVEYPAFQGDASERAAILQGATDLLAPFGVRVTDERPPPELPYKMIMLGGTPSDLPNPPEGYALACNFDCGDIFWRDTGMVFTALFPSDSAAVNGALHVFGQLSGLDILEDSSGLMASTISPGPRTWGTTCMDVDLSFTSGNHCSYVHEVHCPADQQNDHAELLATYGADSPDVAPPKIELLAPADGAELVDFDIPIEVTVSDDHEGFGWKLVVEKDGAALLDAPAFDGETTWTLKNVPAGTYTITVSAIDHDRNVGTDTVTIHVGTPAPPGSSTGDPTTGDPTTDATGDAPTTTRGTTDHDDSATSGDMLADNDGCACAASPTPAPGALLTLLLGLGLVRRRR